MELVGHLHCARVIGGDIDIRQDLELEGLRQNVTAQKELRRLLEFRVTWHLVDDELRGHAQRHELVLLHAVPRDLRGALTEELGGSVGPDGRKVLAEDVERHAPAVFVGLVHDKVRPLVLERGVEFAQACERKYSSCNNPGGVSGVPAGFDGHAQLREKK